MSRYLQFRKFFQKLKAEGKIPHIQITEHRPGYTYPDPGPVDKNGNIIIDSLPGLEPLTKPDNRTMDLTKLAGRKFRPSLTKPEEKEAEEIENKIPSYSDPGRILFEIRDLQPENETEERWEYDVIDYDAESSVFFICESIGIEEWLKQNMTFEKEGRYLISGITANYIPGEWGHTEPEEDWAIETMEPSILQTLLKPTRGHG